MERSELIKWLLWGGPPASGLALRWAVLKRRGEPPRSWWPMRIIRWSMQVATSAGKLVYTEATLTNAKAALAARTADVTEAQTEIDRLRSENARLRRLLASSPDSDDGSPNAPGGLGGARRPLNTSPANKRRSRASLAGNQPAMSSPTRSEASMSGDGHDPRLDP